MTISSDALAQSDEAEREREQEHGESEEREVHLCLSMQRTIRAEGYDLSYKEDVKTGHATQELRAMLERPLR
jgi:hypothetical protein